MENFEQYRDVNVNFWHKITTKDKALFYEHLSNLVDWWVTVINALEAFLQKTKNPKMVKEIWTLLIFVNSWDSFSIAMKKNPWIFDKKEIAIIEAWESSWTMQKSFESLAVQLREQEELKQKAKSALTYPVIIMLFLIVAVVVIMTYVIPKLRPLFENANVELPLSTKALVFTSEFIINNFVVLIILAIWWIVWIKSFKQSESWKRFFDEVTLKLPLVWDVYRNYIIAQIASNLGLLIWAWIPIIKTLILSWEASNNMIYSYAMNMVSDKVMNWKKLTQSFEEVDPLNRYFPSDFLQMIWAWEKTSTVNKVCEKIKIQYTREVDNSLTILIKWIEPLAIFIAWAFVLWFAFAIFSAVLKITETVW